MWRIRRFSRPVPDVHIDYNQHLSIARRRLFVKEVDRLGDYANAAYRYYIHESKDMYAVHLIIIVY
jgi:hypothetical protein